MAAMEGADKSKKVRLPNFTQTEMVTLTQYALDELSSLRAKFGPLVTKEIKNSRWEAITTVINSLGVAHRTWEKVREKWNKMVSLAKTYNFEKKRHAGGTGGGPAFKIDPIKEKIAEAFQDDPSFQGIQGGTESEMPSPPKDDRRETQSPQPSTSATPDNERRPQANILELSTNTSSSKNVHTDKQGCQPMMSMFDSLHFPDIKPLDEVIGQARSASKKEKETRESTDNEMAVMGSTPRKRSHADVLSLQFDVLQATMENEKMRLQQLKHEMEAAKVRRLAAEEMETLQKHKLVLEIRLLERAVEKEEESSRPRSDIDALLESITRTSEL